MTVQEAADKVVDEYWYNELQYESPKEFHEAMEALRAALQEKQDKEFPMCNVDHSP